MRKVKPPKNWEWKLGQDPYALSCFKKYRSEKALIDAGLFVDQSGPETTVKERNNLSWLTTPVHKIIKNLKHLRQNGNQKYAVLVTTGAFAPIHEGHILMMECAKKTLEEQGKAVIGGYLSLSHDLYIAKKCDNPALFNAGQRQLLCEKAVADSDWLMVDPWEARYNTEEVTYTTVLLRLHHYLKKHLPGTDIELHYVFGSDNALFAKAFTSYGHCVCVPRPGYEDKLKKISADPYIKNNPRVVIAKTYDTDLTQSSSTIRSAKRYSLQQPPDAKKYYYAVRNDANWATDIWADMNPSENWPERNKKFMAELIKLLSGTHQKIAFEIVDLPTQQSILEQIGAGRIILNLDVCTTAVNKIHFSRLFGLSDGQHHTSEFVVRPGFESAQRQFRKLASGTYTAIDDDVVTGGTINLLGKVLPKRIRLLPEKIGLLQIYMKQSKTNNDMQLYDAVDCRDFMAGSKDSGLVVSLPNGEICRSPYMLPYVSLASRAKIPPANELKLSLELWKLNYSYFASLKKHMLLFNTDPAFQKLMKYVGFNAHTSLPDICLWHINQLSKTAGVRI